MEKRQAQESFTKNDAQKESRPALIPVEFRAGMRTCLVDPHYGSMSAVFVHVEDYEQGSRLCSATGQHKLIHAACSLAAVFSQTRWLRKEVPVQFLEGMARIMQKGALKYAPDNWRLCAYEDRIRFLDAFYRHCYDYQKGQLFDPETDEPHLLHGACNLAMLHGIDIAAHQADRIRKALSEH